MSNRTPPSSLHRFGTRCHLDFSTLVDLPGRSRMSRAQVTYRVRRIVGTLRWWSWRLAGAVPDPSSRGRYLARGGSASRPPTLGPDPSQVRSASPYLCASCLGCDTGRRPPAPSVIRPRSPSTGIPTASAADGLHSRGLAGRRVGCVVARQAPRLGAGGWAALVGVGHFRGPGRTASPGRGLPVRRGGALRRGLVVGAGAAAAPGVLVLGGSPI